MRVLARKNPTPHREPKIEGFGWLKDAGVRILLGEF
jgi:hypothetical protein